MAPGWRTPARPSGDSRGREHPPCPEGVAAPRYDRILVNDRRLALVPPRYGPDVIGGAELVLREVAHGLAARGWEIDVLTTCAGHHHAWPTHYPAAPSSDGAVTVRRFPVVADTSGRARAELT